jgi:hypothetical protein
MATWTRNAPWRQGHILEDSLARDLQLFCDEDADATAVVVISHDCDIAADVDLEPAIELLVGKYVEIATGDYANTKNVRRLHLQYDCGALTKTIELRSTQKKSVDKHKFLGHSPLADVMLNARNRRVLQKWLSARYDRAAFPNAFEDRLRKKKTHQAIAKILKAEGESIRAIYFDLGDNADNDALPDDYQYELEIYLLHVTEPDAIAAENAATTIKVKLEERFRKDFYDDKKGWIDIELVDCAVISDEAMTVSQSQKLRQWRMDHMSLAEEPNQPLVE